MPSDLAPLGVAHRAAQAVLAPARAVHGRICARLAAQDDAARARGWTVEVLPAGGRVYRDPRFDRLAAHAAGATTAGAGREAR